MRVCCSTASTQWLYAQKAALCWRHSRWRHLLMKISCSMRTYAAEGIAAPQAAQLRRACHLRLLGLQLEWYAQILVCIQCTQDLQSDQYSQAHHLAQQCFLRQSLARSLKVASAVKCVQGLRVPEQRVQGACGRRMKISGSLAQPACLHTTPRMSYCAPAQPGLHHSVCLCAFLSFGKGWHTSEQKRWLEHKLRPDFLRVMKHGPHQVCTQWAASQLAGNAGVHHGMCHEQLR